MTKNLPALSNSVMLGEAPLITFGELSYRLGRCPISRLRPHPGNPRTHNRAHRRKLKKLIGKLGLGAPPVIDENFIILTGCERTETGKELGMREILVIQIFGLSEAKKRAYVLADNRAALDAGWDRKKLSLIIPELTVMLAEEELTIDEATGFEIVEIDELHSDFAAEPDPIDDVELPDRSEPVISLIGDLFTLGEHRLLVADAREQRSFECLMGGGEGGCRDTRCALQPAKRANRRPGPRQAWRFRDGQRRNVQREFCGVSQPDPCQRSKLLAQRRRPLFVHGLARHSLAYGSLGPRLWGDAEYGRLDQEHARPRQLFALAA
jgi:hypothetical protein